MAIYSLDGEALGSVYDLDGNSLSRAYDIDGNVIFEKSGSLINYDSYTFTQKWASKGINATQGFAIHDDKVFWIQKSGNSSVPSTCYVFNLSDGSQALESPTITLHTGHGNSLAFDYPLLYASTAYDPPVVYVNRLSSDYTAVLEKTLKINDGCAALDVCIDENDKTILWTNGLLNSSEHPNQNVISKWDIADLTDNGDGTYTPRLIKSVYTPKPETVLQNAVYYIQGSTFHDGMLWYTNGYNGSSNSYVVAVDVTTGEIAHVIDLQTTAEPEGIQFYPDDTVIGGYAMYVGFLGMALRKYTFESLYQGRTFSILGDSISTFEGYIPSGNENFYTGSNCGVTSVDQTWWKRLAAMTGMTVNVNNSWSASMVSTKNGNASAGCMTRTQNLGSYPDCIIVFMGINDFNHEVAIGTYDGSGEVPTATDTFSEAYAVMLNKIKTAYPYAELFCATALICERNGSIGAPEINDAGVYLTEFNDIIKNIATAFGAKVLDLYECGITYENMPTYMGDYVESSGKALHPNAEGHRLIAQKALADMFAKADA